MQKVEIYRDIDKAKEEMEKWIRAGWKVHTCTMGCVMNYEQILVIYEQ